ncbi:MAG: PadR family transcriptional regulator [Candidatus Micrarchaeota archaeon]|nr:PadR family transcriptional regulator [Candidatus Micrarchaeota archaeon]
MGFGFSNPMHGRSYGLRYWVLYMVSKDEMTGAQIIDQMEHHTMGYWKPSPGSIYPLLNDLAGEGLIRARVKNTMKYYSITEKGRDYTQRIWTPRWIKERLDPEKSINETLDNMEHYCNYIIEKKDSLKSDRKKVERVKAMAKKLGSIK